MTKLIPYAGQEGAKAAQFRSRAERNTRPVRGEPRTARIDLRLTADEKAMLERLAKEQDRTITMIVIRAIRALAEKEKSA